MLAMLFLLMQRHNYSLREEVFQSSVALYLLGCGALECGLCIHQVLCPLLPILLLLIPLLINIWQNKHIWVAIYQLHSPMASLSHSLYDVPRLAPRMDVLFWGQHEFQISFSNRDMSRNAWNRHWRSFMVDRGILSNNMTFPSHKC